MNALPTLRRKIIRYFSALIALYAALGFFLLVCVFLASATTPKIIHLNYDSIAAAREMREAWLALAHPAEFGKKNRAGWDAQFEQALRFEEGNVTEPGEAELCKRVRQQWNAQHAQATFRAEDTGTMLGNLDTIVVLNEKGMFAVANANTAMSRKVLAFALVYLIVSLVLAIFVADALAARLAGPLKSIAEALHRRPKIGARLKLVEPDSLEVLILTTELKRLWDRVSEAEKLNVTELVQQKTKLETVLEAVEDALLVIDLAGTVTHCNQFMLELLNLGERLVIGHKWSDLPTNHENYLGLRAILENELQDSHEIELRRGPNKFQFAARLKKIGNDVDRPIAQLFLLHDITERRQRERFRSEFIDMLSHEIKTPLQSLGTATELLMERAAELPESVRPLAELIAEDVERMKAVASELVQVSQSPSKMMKLNLQTVPLDTAIQDWIRPFKLVGRDKNLTVEFRVASRGSASARIDPVKFPWVVSNLLSNAIRFSPPGGKVEVRVGAKDGHVEIEVADEGPGMSPEDQAHMFDAFYQGRQAVAAGKQGLFGIGLTIAKEVVEAHGGTIEYRARSPHGSEFKIQLPAAV